MRTFITILLLIILPSALFGGDDGYKVEYEGGSITGVKPGSGLKLSIEKVAINLNKGNIPVAAIAPASITEISYGQDVHRRVGAAIGLAVVPFGIGGSKSKKHYIGITWDDGSGNKGGLAIQADKDDYRGILTGLEDVSGKKAVNSDTMSVKN